MVNVLKLIGQLYWSFLKMQAAYAGVVLMWLIVLKVLTDAAARKAQ